MDALTMPAPTTGRAGFYVKGQHFLPHREAQAIARAEWLAHEHNYLVPVWRVLSHGAEAHIIHHATGARHK